MLMAMPKRLRKRARASADLDSIWHYIAGNSVKAADSVLNKIGTVFLLLLDSPLAGSDRSDLIAGLRCFVSGNYIVFYSVLPDGVEIVRVVHARQDINRDDLI